ncbi:MAG TPA: DoxX family protein [Chloroflexia bacterium]|nr:DoxX family protein [Chloroflexia bacterium]
MKSLALLLLRLVTGAFLAGHGAQKLFGSFGGHGLKGTAGWLESTGLKPGKTWALLGGGSEFTGGLLLVLGFLNPVGSLAALGAMGMASTKFHWGKPIWVTSGGAELPVTNMAVATAIALAGPGKYSLDRAFGIKLPRWIFPVGLVITAASIGYGLFISAKPQTNLVPEKAAGAELQAGEEAAHDL